MLFFPCEFLLGFGEQSFLSRKLEIRLFLLKSFGVPLNSIRYILHDTHTKNKQNQSFLILIEACESLDRLSRTKTKKV